MVDGWGCVGVINGGSGAYRLLVDVGEDQMEG